MNHRQKIKLAKKMLTGEEVREGVPLFQSKNWEARYRAKLAKVKQEMEKAKERKELKKIAS